jgi:hypothetical protein
MKKIGKRKQDFSCLFKRNQFGVFFTLLRYVDIWSDLFAIEDKILQSGLAVQMIRCCRFDAADCHGK